MKNEPGQVDDLPLLLCKFQFIVLFLWELSSLRGDSGRRPQGSLVQRELSKIYLIFD